MTTRLALIADTHLDASSRHDLPEAVWTQIAAADLVLHAGDVTTPDLLDRIAAITPVVAVLGNNDVGLDHLPERWVSTIDDVTIAMVHDSGAATGRQRRMRRWFPDAALVVFGHSHRPVDEVGAEGQRLLNPGSPTQRRQSPAHTMATVVVDDGAVATRLIEV